MYLAQDTSYIVCFSRGRGGLPPKGGLPLLTPTTHAPNKPRDRTLHVLQSMNSCSRTLHAARLLSHNLRQCPLATASGRLAFSPLLRSHRVRACASAFWCLRLERVPACSLMPLPCSCDLHAACTSAGPWPATPRSALLARQAALLRSSRRNHQRVSAVVAAPPEVDAMAKTEPQAIYRKVCAGGVSKTDAAATRQPGYAVCAGLASRVRVGRAG